MSARRLHARITRALASLVSAWVLALPLASPGHPHAESEEEESEESQAISFFPRGHAFEPLLADMKEPVFSAAYREVRFGSKAIPARGSRDVSGGLVALGETFELLRWADPDRDRAFQSGIFAAVFSQFDLDSSGDLINSDFTVGFPFTVTQGPWSARLRLYHQSSHLGDEFLLENPDVDREDLSFEVADALVAAEGSWWRLYGGGGYILRTSTGLDRGLAQWGVELRGRPIPGASFRGTDLTPVLGADFQSLEERNWDVTTSLKGGLEWSAEGSTRKLRLLLVYLGGFMPFGQFFNTERLESYGIEVQFAL